MIGVTSAGEADPGITGVSGALTILTCKTMEIALYRYKSSP